MATPQGVPSSFLLKLLAFSLAALAVLLSRTAWTQRPEAPEPRPAAAALQAVGAVHPRIAPDGKSIAFSYQGGVWRIPVEGGTMRRLAGGGGFAVEPCWSPDGRRLAFLRGRTWSTGQVEIIDARTGKGAPLPGDVKVRGVGPLAFTPDGGRLVGNLRLAEQVEALRELDLATGKLRLLVRARSPRQPWALSPDGRWLAQVTTLDVPDQQSGNDGPQVDVWKVTAAGGEPERVCRFPARVHGLCWSADGKALFASAEAGGPHNDLWRIDLGDPDHPAKLTFGQADEDRPSVSADGRWLAYADNHGGAPALVVRDLAAGTDRTLTVERLDFGAPTGRLRLEVKDGATGRPLVARVSLEHRDGSSPAPPGALWRVYRDFAHFYVRETAELELPAGTYRLRAWHGPEYRRADKEIEVTAGQTAGQTVALERWADPNAAGWYCGENHIHANYGYGEYYNLPADMADMCRGEGLNVGNFMVANSDGDGVFDREFFRGRPDPLSNGRTFLYWNEEFRSTIWGHLTLVNLRQVVEPVFTGFKDTTNPYDIPSMSDIAEKTHRQGGLVNYTHPASRLDDLYRGAYSAKGLPVYAALGVIDTVDVMGSADQPSSDLYHRLLNCGLRLSASAGTDCFLNRVLSWLPGGERAYVKLDGPLTYEKWIAGLRAGRSFVTNGPVLELTVNGKGLADVLDLGGPAEVRVKAKASSQYPLDRVEVLYNGKVALSGSPDRGKETTELDQSLRLDRSGWLALRVYGRAVPDVKGEYVYAHTSPVYVRVAGRPAGSAEDARYFLQWIDRLWTAVEDRDRIPGDRWKTQVQAEVEQARKVYQRIIDGEASGGR